MEIRDKQSFGKYSVFLLLQSLVIILLEKYRASQFSVRIQDMFYMQEAVWGSGTIFPWLEKTLFKYSFPS